MDGTTLAAYDRPVPRYTSYPTAAQFHGAVGPVEHRAWLADLAGGSATVYLHVPFCARLCWYCACNTSAMNRPETLDVYGWTLLREIDLVAATVPELLVGSIQWGGGTPSQLGDSRLLEVSRRLAARFDRASGAETSIEIDPRFCDEPLVAAMTAMGVTRASLGVQDFDLGVQQAINRRQSVEDTAAAIGRLRAAGITRINVDLVYGLPHQTLGSLARTLDASIALRPDRFAVFGYAHVPWMKARQRQIDGAALPGTELRAEMVALAAERLEAAGYQRVGLDHFALPSDPLASAASQGLLRRSFQGYVVEEQPTVIGLGASAISSLPRGYTQNATDVRRHEAMIASGSFATARGVETSDSDRLRGEIIERLMCSFSVDLGEVCRRHSVAPDAFIAGIRGLPPLIDHGVVRRDGERLHVTDRGRPLVRFVCAAFDPHLSHTDGRHSRGI